MRAIIHKLRSTIRDLRSTISDPRPSSLVLSSLVHRPSSLIFFLLFALSACSGLGTGGLGGGSGLTGETSGSTTSEEGGATSTDGSSGTDTSPTDGSGEAMPTPVSMPSTLTIDSEKIIAAAEAVGTESLEETSASVGAPLAAPFKGRASPAPTPPVWGLGGIFSYLIKSAWAAVELETHVPIIGYAGAVDPTIIYSDGTTAEMTDADLDGYFDTYQVAVSTAEITDTTTNVCEQTGVVCVSAATNGSFEAYYDDTTNSTTFYVYLTDGTLLSTAISEVPNTNFLWLREEPKDLASSGTGVDPSTHYLSALTNDIGVQIKETGGTFEVQGNYSTSYLDFTATSAEQMAYDSSSTVALLEPTAGLSLFSDLYGDLTDTGTDVTVDDTEAYNFLKYTADGKLRFIRKPLVPEDNSREKIYIVPDNDSEEIVFLDNTTDSGMSGVTISNTLAFDVDSDGWAVVLFEDQDGGVRLRMAESSGCTSSTCDRAGGETALGITGNFIDLQIYRTNSSSTTTGKALLLDGENNRLGVLDLNHETLPRTISINDWINLDKTPVDFVLNTDKTIAHVLMSDGTISSMPLLDSSGNVLTPTQIGERITSTNLMDTVGSDKTLTLNPSTLVYYTAGDGTKKLIVGDQTMKGAIVVDMTSYESTALPTPTTRARRVRSTGSGLLDLPVLGLMVLPRRKRGLRKRGYSDKNKNKMKVTVKSKSKQFTAIYEKRGKWYVGYVEEVPGVNTQGKTLAEAKRNLREALELVLETNRILALGELHSARFVREPLAVNQ